MLLRLCQLLLKQTHFCYGRTFPLNLLDLYGYFFGIVFYRVFPMFALFLFASHSHPFWINSTLTCTSFLLEFFGYLCQCLPIFACQSFSFQLNYLEDTHFLHNNILFLTLIAMMQPTHAKLHPTCANDHNGVRVCHWTTANAS